MGKKIYYKKSPVFSHLACMHSSSRDYHKQEGSDAGSSRWRELWERQQFEVIYEDGVSTWSSRRLRTIAKWRNITQGSNGARIADDPWRRGNNAGSSRWTGIHKGCRIWQLWLYTKRRFSNIEKTHPYQSLCILALRAESATPELHHRQQRQEY